MTPLVLGVIVFIGLLVVSMVGKIFACKHAWEFVDKTEFPAPIEIARKSGITNMWLDDIAKMSKKTSVIVLRCQKCGQAKILRETH